MDFKNKTGYHLVPSEEHNNTVKESPPPIYNEEAGGRENKNKKEKKGKKKKKKFCHRKTFWVCFSDVQIGSRVLSEDENKKKREELDEDGKSKVKEEGFLFSNVEVEEESEKVKELLEKMNKRSCFIVCFSNIRVAQ